MWMGEDVRDGRDVDDDLHIVEKKINTLREFLEKALFFGVSDVFRMCGVLFYLLLGVLVISGV